MRRIPSLRNHSIDALSEPTDERNLSRISEQQVDCASQNSSVLLKDPDHTGKCKQANYVTAKAPFLFPDPTSCEQEKVDLTVASALTPPIELETEVPPNCVPQASFHNSGSTNRAANPSKWFYRRTALQRNFSANSRINSNKPCAQTQEKHGTFLSNLCDARPTAMSGFLGVTSAALVMARAMSPEMLRKRTRNSSPLAMDEAASCESCTFSGKVSNRCSSETNLISFASPIIIRTSHITSDHSTELVYPDMQQSAEMATVTRLSMHSNLKKPDTRVLSASLGDLPDTSNLLEPRTVFTTTTTDNKSNNNSSRHPAPGLGQRIPWPKEFRADVCCHKGPTYRTLSEESNDSRPRAGIAPVENLEPFSSKGHYRQLEKPHYRQCEANNGMRNFDRCCPRCKYKDYLGKHALSTNHLASLSKRKYGIDEISYDFMRASGAISGFSQLRSVKDIKHEREKQEMCSALSAAIASSLDTGGAVAALAANTRPRFKATWIKKRLQVSSQEEPSLESRASNPYVQDAEILERSSCGSSFPHVSKHNHSESFLPDCGPTAKHAPGRVILNPRLTEDTSLARDNSGIRKDADIGLAWEQNDYINYFSTSDMTKCLSQGDHQLSVPSGENSIAEQASFPTIQNSFSRGSINIIPTDCAPDDILEKKPNPEADFAVKLERLRRPHYFQKAQMFRQSWRTQSVEQSTLADVVTIKRRSLTRVDSDSEQENEVPRFVNVVVERGAPNPVKTILINNSTDAHNSNNTERIRRQRTFANKRHWKSVQLPSVNISEPDDEAAELVSHKESITPVQQVDTRALLQSRRGECGFTHSMQTSREDLDPKVNVPTGSRKSSVTRLICEAKRKPESKLVQEINVNDKDYLKPHELHQMSQSQSGEDSDSEEAFARDAFQKQRQKR
ncbi:unnamed protein product [Schistocephalus solidus]|uniref:CaMBD domain-containing protein n=1 Tax=Schistocephalus solidus TaxID=70667 RepID=A0A183SSK4_SCHSO|nr:unnamed protein product [Schistocephalus solidus]